MPLLRVRHLSKRFHIGKRRLLRARATLLAVDDVSFDIDAGETLGLVGESGCGKTTTGRLCLRLIEPSSGSICFNGTELATLDNARLRGLRRDMQIIFQDPFGALNPRMTVGELILEPLEIHAIGDAASRAARLTQLLELVGLAERHASRFPHEFSGGQRQRICIARALALNPKLIVCDEAASALDVSIQAQILNLLHDLKHELGLTYLFISHDLGVIRHICDRVAVMYLGQIVELAPKRALFNSPRHPYTQALLKSVPTARRQEHRSQPAVRSIQGDVPSPAAPPSGCRFHTRCPMVQEICKSQPPPLRTLDLQHEVACHFAEGIDQMRTQVTAPT